MKTNQGLDDLITQLATEGVRLGYLVISSTSGQTIKLTLTQKGHDFLAEYLDERDWRVRMEAW